MAIGYRTILSTEAAAENVEGIVRVLRDWAISKKRFRSLPTDGVTERNRRGSTLTATQYGDQSSGAYRWVLVEDWGNPEWLGDGSSTRFGTTHITLVYSAAEVVLWVDIEPPMLTTRNWAGRETVGPQYTGTPGFVSGILDEVAMRDGITAPTSDLMTIATPSHLEELIRTLEDDTRLGAVYVTTPPEGVSVNEWSKKASDFVGAIQGLGFGYVLSHDTLPIFNSRARFGHSIAPGSMRTFLPGADLDNPDDSINHKLLHPSTLQNSDERRIRRIIRNAQLQRMRDMRLPAELREADYEFLRRERRRPFEVLYAPAPIETIKAADASLEAKLSTAENQIKELLSRLKDAETLVEEGGTELQNMSRELEETRDEAEFAEEDNNEMYRELVVYRADTAQLREQVTELQRRLANLGADGVAAAYEPVETVKPERYPETFEELYARLTEIPGIRFFGDKDEVLNLDEHSILGDTPRMKAWDALRTFSAYVTARQEDGFDQSLRYYLRHREHGHPVYLNARVIWGEGSTVRTNRKMSAQRRVSGLPTSIAEDGVLDLVSHVRLATIGTVAPRLYFEDTYDKAGFILIGHLGGHLTNTQTN